MIKRLECDDDDVLIEILECDDDDLLIEISECDDDDVVRKLKYDDDGTDHVVTDQSMMMKMLLFKKSRC